jgi:uncharacterized membrane protein
MPIRCFANKFMECCLMDSSLIPADNNMAIWAILVGIVAFGFWSEKTRLGRRLSGTIVVLISAFLLSNLGIIPDSAPVYDTVMSTFVPLALALLLLRVDLRALRKEAGPTLSIFAIGAFGTILGALAAFYFVPLESNQAELAGMFAATYIGGSGNFAAVADAFGVTDGNVLVPAVAADTIATISYLVVLGALPGMAFFSKKFRFANAPVATAKATPAGTWSMSQFDVAGTLISLFLAFVFVIAGDAVQSLSDTRGVSILTITVLAVATGTIFADRIKPAQGPFQLGMILMLLFFAALGATGSLGKLVESGFSLLLFTVTILGVHFIVVFGLGYLFKFDLAEIAVASNACACGPPTAAGMAADAGWDHLVTPAILAGSLGFAVASFAGIGVGNFLN